MKNSPESFLSYTVIQQQEVAVANMNSGSVARLSFPPHNMRIFATKTSGCKDLVVLSYVRHRIALGSELPIADPYHKDAMIRSALLGKTRPPATLTPEQEQEASLILNAYYDFVQRK